MYDAHLFSYPDNKSLSSNSLACVAGVMRLQGKKNKNKNKKKKKNKKNNKNNKKRQPLIAGNAGNKLI